MHTLYLSASEVRERSTRGFVRSKPCSNLLPFLCQSNTGFAVSDGATSYDPELGCEKTGSRHVLETTPVVMVLQGTVLQTCRVSGTVVDAKAPVICELPM